MRRQTSRCRGLLIWAFVFLAAAAHAQAGDQHRPLELADQGATRLHIVQPVSPSRVDVYAVELLARNLTEATGATFPILNPDQLPPGAAAIFVGLSEAALARLQAAGQAPPDLTPQEHVNLVVGADLLLWGQGIHGNLDAVVLFLERTLGRQWYSAYENPLVPRHATWTIRNANHRRGFSFTHRSIMLRYYEDFNAQMGKNMVFRRTVVAQDGRMRIEPRGPFVNLQANDIFVHAIQLYINPDPGVTGAKEFDWAGYSETLNWLDRKNYFETNPEYFSLHANGRRVKNMQLCFSEAGLRRELTRQILAHIALAGEDNIITVDAADTPDHFCYCDGCKALERKYQSPGGPLYDYLLELCALLQREHPSVMVKTAAYRRAQTQIPPAAETLPDGRFPDNLIVMFAPIEDNYFADWDHPDAEIQQTLADLRAWRQVTSHLWAWLYPNPYGSGGMVPVGNIRRIATNLRHMHRTGVTGVFIDHNGPLTRSGWAELQTYLMHRLMQDVDCDVNAVVREFTDFHYGSAGSLMRQYLDELEQHRLAMTTLPKRVTFKSRGFEEATFPYLTAANVHRWQELFDAMDLSTAAEPLAREHVQQARRELDFATLIRWFDLKKLAPASYGDHKVFADRIQSVNGRTPTASGKTVLPLGRDLLRELVTVIEAGGQRKPLPAPLDKLDSDDVHQLLPTNSARTGQKMVVDPEAAFGYAITVDMPDLPLQVGFYQWITREPATGVEGARIALARQDITPGKYQLHQLGLITATPDSWIWFSAKSWQTFLQLGDRVYEPGESNQWMAYVSMKCDGPSYGGTAAQDVVLVDRIVLVAASAAGASLGPPPAAAPGARASTDGVAAWRAVSANLLRSGDAEGLGPAAGWSGLVERHVDDTHGGQASLRMSSNNAIAMSPELVPIDPRKTYRLSGWMKSTDASRPARGLIDLRQYDARQSEIFPWTVRPVTSMGKLVAPAEKGAKTLRLSAADWPLDSLSKEATLLSVEMDAREGAGELPAGTVYRLSRVEAAAGDCTLHLRAATERAWPQNTLVRLHRYVDHPRTFDDRVPGQWTYYSVIIRALPENGMAAANTLWPGASMARIAVLSQNLGAEGAALLFDDLELVEVEK